MFSIVAVPVCIPTNSVGGFPFKRLLLSELPSVRVGTGLQNPCTYPHLVWGPRPLKFQTELHLAGGADSDRERSGRGRTENQTRAGLWGWGQRVISGGASSECGT